MPVRPKIRINMARVVEHLGGDPSTVLDGSVTLEVDYEGGKVTWTEVRTMSAQEAEDLINVALVQPL